MSKEEDWKRLLDPTLQKQVLCLHLREITEHLHRLTLRHPSEDLVAHLTVLLLLHDQARFMDGVALRSSYLSTKAQFKTYLTALGKNDTNQLPLLRELPADPKDLGEPYRRQAFGDGNPCPMPPSVKMDQLIMLAELVPQRGNHSSLKLVTQPMMPTTMTMGKGGWPHPQRSSRQHDQYFQAAMSSGLYLHIPFLWQKQK